MNLLTSIVQYLRSSKAELQKVTWPSRKETIRYSVLVLTVSVVVAAFFATLDFGLGKVVTAALEKRDTLKAATTEEEQMPVTAPVETTPTFELNDESPTLVPIDVETTPSETPTP
ncbi:preprotein translocase subunit SecE [Patescibacteria group bacterium]|nr:preprotein translocase subunit SecE [Patescibacteria group bacterium]MBU1448647.1 preprotein translocase subunit SecE [Patescibacteria group bacterium]MBU2612905.1 preprotein translocase subunit SecE [Patescibacteria group bacterium]